MDEGSPAYEWPVKVEAAFKKKSKQQLKNKNIKNQIDLNESLKIIALLKKIFLITSLNL